MKRTFGQALHFNRPHLVAKGELTPRIALAEFQARRKKFLSLMRPSSLAIVGGNRIQFASPSVFYPFRQDVNFQYLTGFLEPDSCFLAHKDAGGNVQEILFVPEKDEFAEKWEGDRTGTEQARQVFGIDCVLSNDKLRNTVKSLLGASESVHCDLDPKITVRQGSFFNHELPALVAQKANGVTSANDLVQTLREVKSEAEIDCLRTAGEISARAYNVAFKRQHASETELQALLSFLFKTGGCEEDAYYPVVAGGSRALTIHYVRNDQLLNKDELVLVDAAGRFGGYCADISRTWPVSGKFSSPQRDLYQAVLETEKSCIDLCSTSVTGGGLSLADIHRASELLLQQNLKNAGLHLTNHQLSIVYPHMIGHQLGLDVHDIGMRSSLTKPLVHNQVITIEPGVYVPFDDQFPKHFQGIGIRIEDNVVVGVEREVLTSDCLKEVKDLENL